MNLSDTSTEVTPTKTNRSDLQYSPRDELDLSLSNSSQTDTIVSITARENAQLRTENERLEQENEKLEQENERLEEENVHLKKELARLNGTNLQERRCLKPWSQLGRERKRRLLKDILGTVQNVADHYDTSVICVSANIMYRGAFAVKRYDILKIARRIEANASLKKGKGKMPELVASWLILRGKGGDLVLQGQNDGYGLGLIAEENLESLHKIGRATRERGARRANAKDNMIDTLTK